MKNYYEAEYENQAGSRKNHMSRHFFSWNGKLSHIHSNLNKEPLDKEFEGRRSKNLKKICHFEYFYHCKQPSIRKQSKLAKIICYT